MSAVAVTTPLAYQPIQRDVNNRASIAIAGTYTFASSCHLEADWNNNGFSRIATLSSGTAAPFTGTLSSQQSAALRSQGTLTVRIEEDHATVATVAYIGIGDIFPCWGQSNMVGMGDNAQFYSHPTLKASFSPLNGTSWGDLNAAESAGNGSFRPLLATQIMARTGFPVGFIMCAAAGTPISSWLPSDPSGNYTAYVKNGTLLAAPAGTAALLGWEGESDILGGTSQATFKADLDTIVAAVRSDIGVKTMPCQLETITASAPAQLAIRNAIGQVWAGGGNALTGPDLVSIVVGLHLTSDADLLTAAMDWFNALVIANLLPLSQSFLVTRAAQ